jgi:diguanylate cyclase (GGDEF)-like protein
MMRQIVHQASHDALTGLVNRREFEERLSRAVTTAKDQGLQHALAYLDLDHFKIVNDSAGHVAGDALLT